MCRVKGVVTDRERLRIIKVLRLNDCVCVCV